MEAPVIEIRAGTATDVPAILPMVTKICDFHRERDPGRYPFLPDVAARYGGWLKQRSEDADSCLLVARHGEVIVAFVVGEILDEIPVFTTTRYGWLHDLWVEPEYRRHGVASRLMQAACEALASRGVSQIRGDCLHDNAASLAMLANLGFRPSTLLMIRQLGATDGLPSETR
jgi:ribosomal protein S18 acetylase RimI-like enzyme